MQRRRRYIRLKVKKLTRRRQLKTRKRRILRR